jgi:alpha-L-fucosidase
VLNDRYKSAGEVVSKLVEIVAKGGSLLLGVGPKADGTLPDDVITKLEEIGKWTSKNGTAIYGTRITKNYHDGQNWFTQSKDGQTIYGISLLGNTPVKEISWQGSMPKKGSLITILSTNQKVKWKSKDGKVYFDFPKTDEKIALTFSFTPETN